MKNRILLVQMREENKTLLLPHSISVYTPEFPQGESLKNHKTKTSYNSITIKTISHLNLLPRIIVMYYHLQFFKGNTLFFKHNLSLVLPSYSPIPPITEAAAGGLNLWRSCFRMKIVQTAGATIMSAPNWERKKGAMEFRGRWNWSFQCDSTHCWNGGTSSLQS